MFTGKTTTLSEMANAFAQVRFDLIRDCEFAYAGRIPTHLPRRLVAIEEREHLEELTGCQGIAGVLAVPELVDEVPRSLGLAVCQNPFATLLSCHEYLIDLKNWQWQDFESEIHESAEIHPTAHVEPRNVRIGPRTVIAPQAVVLERSIIGADCYVGPHSVIGAEAFEIFPESDPARLVKQSGGVNIGNGVTVLSGVKIVRATFGGFTLLEDGAAIDNLTHIAHDCIIGRNAKVVACAELSGRVVVGENAYIGPNATVSNGLTIGDNATVTLGSVVVRDVEENQRVTGNFALPHRKWIEFIKGIR